ncbi:MAG: hypothetical protein AB1765_01255 [Candidatus Hydrogenedentota bacterium]
MSEILSHRGPDNSGYYISPDNKVHLGHTRLSIIDLEKGDQPMCNEDGDIIIVYNGELYNYPILRKELIEKGHRFKSNSDTEIFLHLYEEAGFSMVDRLDGIFAFAIFDSKKIIISFFYG